MPRTRKYADDAEKQSAYRARLTDTTVLIDRRSQTLMIRRLDALHEAVKAAAKAGDTMAVECCALSPETVIENLTRHFEAIEQMAASQTSMKESENAGGTEPHEHRKRTGQR